MQTTRKNMRIGHTIPADIESKLKQLPNHKTSIVVGAITAGAIIASLVLKYYLHKRK
jgi:hypothetical protein